MSNLKTEPGKPYLFGAVCDHTGCNFSIFSKNAESISILLFDQNNFKSPSHTLDLDKKINKTGDVWHIYIYGITHGQLYGIIADGPYQPEIKGHRFNKNKLLIDPYTKAVTGSYQWQKINAFGYNINSVKGDLSFNNENNYATEVKNIVIEDGNFDWDNDKPLNIPLTDTVIYEMHVRGYTNHKSSGVKHPGTFLGIIDKLPYLKELGITAIELLPIQEFNEQENIRTNPVTKERLVNFWGYSTLAFFAPDTWYSTAKNGIDAVREFKEMIKACHKAGIEVILDVVYNHTGEGNEYGPTLNFRGLDNSIYYMLDGGRHYKNYSGCGNTLNCNHPVVKRLILDSLRYWVVDMHVDGFRFDLAAILGRDTKGDWTSDYSVLSEISGDPILSNVKLIAEGWDAAGLYKVGDFPEEWAEWNGRFRDDARSFLKGDPGVSFEFAKRIMGSPDLFLGKNKKPFHSINFITCHDGFTLNDLVSYNAKHNEENGENNKDGSDYNLSFNCGIEGPSDDVKINMMRERHMRNFIALLMISQGTPMIHAGDEFKFSKKGNNNTYCHDNDLNWLNWDLAVKNSDFFDFTKNMIKFRKRHHALRMKKFFDTEGQKKGKIPEIKFSGTHLAEPGWEYDTHCLAFMLNGYQDAAGYDKNDNAIYAAVNTYTEDMDFNLPPSPNGGKWHLCVNTADYPFYYDENNSAEIPGSMITVKSGSIVILIEKTEK